MVAKPLITFEDLARAKRIDFPKPEKEKFDAAQYNRKYNETHYVRVGIMLPKDKRLKERVKKCADNEGISVNAWITRAIEKELEWYE